VTPVRSRTHERHRSARAADTAAARQIVVGCRDELARADSKASLLIGITVGAIGLFGPALQPVDHGTASLAYITVAWSGVVMWAGALSAFTTAVFPRLKSRSSAPAAYFKVIAQSTSSAHLHGYVRSIAAAPLPHLLIQARDLSHIVTIKYRWSQVGVWLLLLGGLLELASWRLA
jgi:hypothetical protein